MAVFANNYQKTWPLSARLLSPTLEAWGAPTVRIVDSTFRGMPAAGAYIHALRSAVVAVEVKRTDLRADLSPHARQIGDILMIKHKLGGIDSLQVDVALRLPTNVATFDDLLFYRHVGGGLWLVPTAAGPCVRIDRVGLTLELGVPFRDLDDRDAGLSRAKSEFALLAAPSMRCWPGAGEVSARIAKKIS